VQWRNYWPRRSCNAGGAGICGAEIIALTFSLKFNTAIFVQMCAVMSKLVSNGVAAVQIYC